MTSPFLPDSMTVAEEFLQHVESMRQQLRIATDAIARNSLQDFEQSLWQQEMISSCMRRSILLLRGLQLAPGLLKQLRVANASLQQDSMAYRGLIGQSSQTAQLLHGLCTLHGQRSFATTSQSSTLSCEA